MTKETWETVRMTETDGSTVTLTYEPTQSIAVQPGDIVGIMMPVDDNERMESVKPVFVELPDGNLSTYSCARLDDSRQIFLSHDQSCIGGPQQLLKYIPLITVTIG